MKNVSDHLLEDTIKSENSDHYRIYCNNRNRFSRKAKNIADEKLKERCSNNKLMWKEIN